jgi:hypothetical protein
MHKKKKKEWENKDQNLVTVIGNFLLEDNIFILG